MKTNLLLILFTLCLFTFSAMADVTNGLVAYYPFEGNANDASGNGNNGSLSNTTFLAARCGLGLSTTGFTNSYFEVQDENGTLNPTHAVSISFWVKLRSFPNTYSCVIYKAAITPTAGDHGDRSYSVWIRSDGGIHFTSTPEGTASQLICNSPAGGIQIGQLAHIVAIVDVLSQQMNVYINGRPVASSPYSGTAIRYGKFPLRIGGPFFTLNDQSGMDGVVDDVRIYNRVLTDSEISDLFHACPPTAPVVNISSPQVALCWDTVPGADYQLQYRSVLTSNEWVPFTTNLIVGTGSEFCTNDNLSAEHRYYRVVATNSPAQ